MQILLHVCCGPCAIYPLRQFRNQGHSIKGYFHNPNIHPFKEFQRRIQAIEQLCEHENFEVIYDNKYGLKHFLRQVVFKEQTRCLHCVEMRLEETAQKALALGADGFSSTLLYSRYQNHEHIRKTGEVTALKYNLEFLYEDFREGWQQGIDASIEKGLYRQPYCGCIYSEQERYDKSLRNNNKTRKKEKI